MKILVIGNLSNFEELQQKFGPSHTYLLDDPRADSEELIKGVDVVFDFGSEPNPINLRYSNFEPPVFLNSSLMTLSERISRSDFTHHDSFFGFCGLPTFVNRSVLEVSISSAKSEAQLKSICSQLETDFVCVEDRVGLVTPRVIFMIINEAYCAIEEDIATRDDIDLAMKLGTNYPHGPFEWAKRIGVKNIIELLDAVYRDTQDDRYKVCDLLRRELTY